MKLYKYRSLQEFNFVTDILREQRFHTSSFFDLNDPMEGLFEYPRGTKQKYIEAIVEGKRKLRICSFSKDRKNILLWAHYADGFKGICIEVDLREPQLEDMEGYEIVTVEYSSQRVSFSNNARHIVDEMPRIILSKKSSVWKYEKEIRTLSRDEYIHDGVSIKSVLLGLRTPEILKEAIFRITPPDIPIFETYIGKSNEVVQERQRFRPRGAGNCR